MDAISPSLDTAPAAPAGSSPTATSAGSSNPFEQLLSGMMPAGTVAPVVDETPSDPAAEATDAPVPALAMSPARDDLALTTALAPATPVALVSVTPKQAQTEALDLPSEADASAASATPDALLAELAFMALPRSATAPAVATAGLPGASAAAMPGVRAAPVAALTLPGEQRPTGAAASAPASVAASVADGAETRLPAVVSTATTTLPPATALAGSMALALRDAAQGQSAGTGSDAGATALLPGMSPLAGASLPATATVAADPGRFQAPATAPSLLISQHALQDRSGWSDAVGNRVAWLTQNGIPAASLQITPGDLGPIHVRIAMGEQGARVEFTAHQAATTDLIESMLPRLASAFEAQGMRLDDVRVSTSAAAQPSFSQLSQGSGQRQGGDGGQQAGSGTSAGAGRSASPGEGIDSAPVRHLPLAGSGRAVDYYA